MSHHYSGPDFGFPHGDARLDFTDLFAFPKPGDAGKSILIMNVHPSVVLISSRPTTPEPFASEAVYELKIETDGDAVADIAYRVSFSPYERPVRAAFVGLGRIYDLNMRAYVDNPDVEVVALVDPSEERRD